MKKQVWLLGIGILTSLLLLVEFPTNSQAGSYGPCDLPSKFEVYEVRTMKMGDSGYASAKAILVDENGKCWIKAEAELSKEVSSSLKNSDRGWVRIERHPEGFFIYVTKYLNKPIKWSREYIPYQKDKIRDKRILPIFSIQEVNFFH